MPLFVFSPAAWRTGRVCLFPEEIVAMRRTRILIAAVGACGLLWAGCDEPGVAPGIKKNKDGGLVADVTKQLADLKSNDAKVRLKAAIDLGLLGPGNEDEVIPALEAALAAEKNKEAKERMRYTLRMMKTVHVSPGSRR